MAIVLNILAIERGDLKWKAATFFYPVTSADFDRASYLEFGDGYFLTGTGTIWCWDMYLPNKEKRSDPHASPLNADDKVLAKFPPSLLVTGECDILRDEGEAFAAKLRKAGAPVTAVRYGWIIHDFVMANPMYETHAAQAAIKQAIEHLKAALQYVGCSVLQDTSSHMNEGVERLVGYMK